MFDVIVTSRSSAPSRYAPFSRKNSALPKRGRRHNLHEHERAVVVRKLPARVASEMHIFENGPHGFGMGQTDPSLGTWPTLLANWMRGRGLLSRSTSESEPLMVFGAP